VNHGMKSRSGSSSIDVDIALEDLSVAADFSAGEAQVEVSVLQETGKMPRLMRFLRAMAVIKTSSEVQTKRTDRVE